jgi:DNA-binding transcriptional MerR regulator
VGVNHEPVSIGGRYFLTTPCHPFTFKKHGCFHFQRGATFMKEAYDSKMASRIVGVSLRQIQYWDERGFVRPSVKPAQGRGTKRLYSFHDLVCLKVVKDLTYHGISLQKIRRCLQPLRQYAAKAEQPLDSLKYVTDGEKLFVITSDRKKILDAMERHFVLSLGIGNLVRELNGEVRRAAQAAGGQTTGMLRRLQEKRTGSA